MPDNFEKAATLAQMVVKEKPENDKARGLAAHALARLEIEYGIPQQIMAAKKLFEGIETPLIPLQKSCGGNDSTGRR